MRFNICFATVLLSAMFFFASCKAAKNVQANDDGNLKKTPAETEKKETNLNKPLRNGAFETNLPANFDVPNDIVGQKLLDEYGAIFVAEAGVKVPEKILFRDSAETVGFQESVEKSTENIGGINIELQTPAMNSLKNALAEARQNSVKISPRGTLAAKRDYAENEKLWKSRVETGLQHWVSAGKLPRSEAERIKSLSAFDQIPEILKLEARGIYFSKDLGKSILNSAAAPGASQHLFLLALDIWEFGNKRARDILANHGWFQTVRNDEPHFTYLGLKESELPAKGLKAVMVYGHKYWVPDLTK